MRKELKAENVCFAYPSDLQQPVLKDISFSVTTGMSVAVVGENGAGKSTLTKLLTRLYEPTSGAIYWEGENLSTFAADQIHLIFAVAFQNHYRYELTLRENIALANLDELNNSGKMIQVLQTLNLEELVNKLDCTLGKLTKDSFGLSDGQWQKVRVARVLFSNAPIAILDEPTADLDPISESQFYENFLKVRQNRTTFIISHCLASAKLADMILVMRHGEIIEQGTHQKLMAAAHIINGCLICRQCGTVLRSLV